jgi:hypothetical protein
MNQVIRDIHYLLVSLQVIWKTVERMCDPDLYPHFATMLPVRDKWQSYFEQYEKPRNTFEHFDDQVIGPDTRKNNPGFGVKLTSDGGFSLGTQKPALINKVAQDQLVEFKMEFGECIDDVVGPTA